MLNENAHKNFTACGDAEAEALLEKVLAEIGTALSGTALSVVLGGSYGRGDGGVRQDKENGILYNDLDFFAFSRTRRPAEEMYVSSSASIVRFSPEMAARSSSSNTDALEESTLPCTLTMVSVIFVTMLIKIPFGTVYHNII